MTHDSNAPAVLVLDSFGTGTYLAVLSYHRVFAYYRIFYLSAFLYDCAGHQYRVIYNSTLFDDNAVGYH